MTHGRLFQSRLLEDPNGRLMGVPISQVQEPAKPIHEQLLQRVFLGIEQRLSRIEELVCRRIEANELGIRIGDDRNSQGGRQDLEIENITPERRPVDYGDFGSSRQVEALDAASFLATNRHASQIE